MKTKNSQKTTFGFGNPAGLAKERRIELPEKMQKTGNNAGLHGV